MNSLVCTRTVKSVSGWQFNFINFNHDLLAEQGIIHAEKTGLESDDFEKKKLLDVIYESGDPNTTLMLCLWLYSKKRNNNEYIQKLKTIMKCNLALNSGKFMGLYYEIAAT